MLKVYGHPASQPSRSVIWACVINELPIEVEPNPRYLAKVNPRGQMPVIDDSGYVLWEMPAILCYLAEKHGWHDLYPDDLRVKGKINAYLHTHHSLTRLATMKLMAPNIHVAFGGPQLGNDTQYIFNTCLQTSMSDDEQLTQGRLVVEQVVEHLDNAYLSQHAFIAGTDHATLADIACYDEIGQLHHANLLNFQPFENVSKWLTRMRQLPFHDSLHTFNTQLGDINTTPNTVARFKLAETSALQALSKLESVKYP